MPLSAAVHHLPGVDERPLVACPSLLDDGPDHRQHWRCRLQGRGGEPSAEVVQRPRSRPGIHSDNDTGGRERQQPRDRHADRKKRVRKTDTETKLQGQIAQKRHTKTGRQATPGISRNKLTT